MRFLSQFRYTRDELVRMSVLFVGFLVAAQIGRILFTSPAVIQPAAGVALAALILYGTRLWPAVATAAAVNALVISGAPLPIAIGGVLAYTLHAVVGAGILRAFGFDPVFRRLRDMSMFIGVALGSALIIPTVGLLGIMLHNAFIDPDWPIRVTFFSWWAGIIIGNFTITPCIVRWIAKPGFERTPLEWLEIGAAIVASVGLTYTISWIKVSEAADGALLIVWFVMFIWFGLRLGTRFTFLAYLLATATGITGILYGTREAAKTAGERLVGGEIFLVAIGVVLFLFLALMEERKRVAKALRGQLERVNTLLEESKRQDRAKSEFIAVFAHELRNPLAPIVSSLEILKMRWGAHAEISPIVNTMDDRTRTIVRLLDDLLDISRISRQSFKLQCEHIDLRQCVERVTDSMQELARRHGLTLTMTVPQIPVPMYADTVRIEQILGNLLMNSIKYTESGGRIAVTVQQNAAEATLRVRDTGVGIPRELLSRIFQPFAGLGVEHRQRTIKEGLGIGLWLTENLVKTHGGTIRAESEGPGHGAEFILTFPIAENPSEKDVPAIEPIEMPRQGALKVLVVDDNEAAAKGLGTLLEYGGNTVALAFAGAEAVQKSREFEPDAVVLDIGLPDLSGYDVARLLRGEGFRGKLVALTGYGQEEDKKKAADAGFDHHLTKPIGIADLQAVLFQPRVV